jgi:urease accessory protein
MKIRFLFAIAMLGALSLFPCSVLAHTGGGAFPGFGSGFAHPISGSDHLLAMIAVGLWAAQRGGKALWIVPGVFVALMIFGGVLAISKIPVPYVEEGILLSVLILGIVIAVGLRLPLGIQAFIVGVFAVFHGHAHGTEIPFAAEAVTYSLGFASGTALLHAAGAACGWMLHKLNIGKAIRLVGGVIVLGGMYLVVG